MSVPMKVMVTGARGQIGREVVELLGTDEDAFEVIALAHDALDVTDEAEVKRALVELGPAAVVNCAAYTAVDACEAHPHEAFAANAEAPRHLMLAARSIGAYVVHLSTDYVFDGTKPTPYVESDRPNPQSVYGASKLAGEEAIDETGAVIRASWVVGRYGSNMVKTILRIAPEQPTLSFVDDQRGNPTIASDLAIMIRRFVDERPTGIWHVTNQGAVSWYEFAQVVLDAMGDDPSRVRPISTAELDPPRPASRPANSVLENRRLHEQGIPLLPDFRDSLDLLVAELQA